MDRSVLDKLQQRYPDIHFSLSFFPPQKKRRYSSKQIRKHFLEWKQNQSFDHIEILYSIGLESIEVFLESKAWLSQKKERVLIFVENHLEMFSSFLNIPFAKHVLDHPQVHLFYSEEDAIESLAQRFPTDRLAIFVPAKRTFETEKLLRRSAVVSALYSDVLYSHHLFKNVYTNFLRMKDAFDVNQWKNGFVNIPAIICGAGPSLEKSFSQLKNLETKALIIAGGSAVPILSKQGIRPHLAIALDPNEEEFKRFQQNLHFELPFVFSPRLHHNVFTTCNGPFGYLKTDTGGLAENWLEKQLGLTYDAIGPDLGDEAFSVITLAISMAYAFGCNPIIFTGMDLSFSEGKHYATGINPIEIDKKNPAALEKTVICHDIFGKPVTSLLKWIMEKDAISRFATMHCDRLFFNATQGGIGFKDIKNLPLEEIAKTYGFRSFDIEGFIHQKIQTTPCSISEKILLSQYEKLYRSLKESLHICEEILKEFEEKKEKALHAGKVILLQQDFVEQIAYECFLKGIDIALNQLLFRYFPDLDNQKTILQREVAKWQELKRQITQFSQVFK